MSENIKIDNRLRNIIAILLSAFFIYVCVFSFVKTKSMINKPFPGFLALKNNVVSVLWLPDWEGFKRGIKVRDVILAVNEQPVKNSDELNDLVSKEKPGTILTYTVERGGHTFQTVVPVSLFTLSDFLQSYIPWTLVAVVFFSIGLAVFYMKPDSAASVAFLIFGCIGAFVNASFFEHCSTHFSYLPMYLFPAFGPSVLLLSLYFPKVYETRKYFVALILVTVIPLIVMYRISFSNVHLFLLVDSVNLIYLVITFTLGVFLMCYSFFTATDPLIRQKGKMIIYGFIAMTLGGGMVLFGVLITKNLSFYWLILPSSFVFFTLGYAIVKHNVFDADLFIRRSTSYLLVSAIALLCFFFVIGLFSLLLQNVTGQSSQIAAIIATIISFTIFRPLLGRIERHIDKRYFREKYEYQQTIQKASRILINIIELDQLLYQMLDTVLDAMQIKRGIIILREKDPERFQLAAVEDFSEDFKPEYESESEPSPSFVVYPVNHPIYEYLETSHKPVQINDIGVWPELKNNQGTMFKFMQELGIVLVVPIVYEWRLIGVLGLSEKKSGSWFSGEDVELIQTLMNQTAVSIENAHKVVELKKMVELEASYRELQRLNELKDNFISMVSHDLRTPMTCIKGYASILQNDPKQFDNETTKEYLNIIVDESDRLTRLINNILDIQRFEAGGMALNLKYMDINKLVEEVFNLFQPPAEEKNLFFEKSIPNTGIIIRGDGDRLHQAFANLLSNAIKFTPEGGKVKTMVEEIAFDGDLMVKVSVSDTGPGIPEDKRGRLFQKFQQIDNLVREKEEGSGLGLALVKEIIEHHGGKVGMESEVGKGSTFYFYLKVHNRQE